MASDPYKIEGPALLRISGGRTSGFMLKHILDAYGGTLPEDVRPVFCNTGLEHEATLQFVREMGERWWPLTWLEYRYQKPEPTTEPVFAAKLREALGDDYEVTAKPLGKHTFAVVDYCTASRNGEPFEAVIEARQFIPNTMTRFCTAELKIRTGNRFAKSLGWKDWDCAVGFRADEPHRLSGIKGDESGETVVCPMYSAGHGIRDVREFWRSQPFDLHLPGDDTAFGNCVGCFLKTRAKLEKVYRTNPEAVEWFARQEGRFTDSEGRPSVWRIDRETVGQLIVNLSVQGQLYDDAIEDDTLPCHCTD